MKKIIAILGIVLLFAISNKAYCANKPSSSSTSGSKKSGPKAYDYSVYYNVGYDGVTVSGKPDAALETLTDRVNKLINAGQNGKFNDSLKELLTGDESLVTLITTIGRYIIYACILFFGIRAIWGGVDGKTQFKEIIPYLLIGIVFFFCAEKLIGIVAKAFSGGQEFSEGNLTGEVNYDDFGSSMFGTIVYIVRVLTFGGISFAGIKLLFSNAEKKAEIKNTMIAILVGCIFIFSSSLIVEIVVSVFDEAKKSENLNENREKIVARCDDINLLI